MKNKILIFSLALLMAINLCPANAFVSGAISVMAETSDVKTGKCGDNLTYTIDGTTLTISGSGDMYDYYALAGSYAPWFEDYKSGNITNVVIENGVTSIGNHAFSMLDCDPEPDVDRTDDTIKDDDIKDQNPASATLETYADSTAADGITFSIASTVTKIGSYAFLSTTNLYQITIPASLTVIMDNAFNGCTNLTDVYYLSDESHWSEITISTEGNSALLENATIHYSTPAQELSDCTVTLTSTSYTYDGTAKKPAITVKNGTATLVNGTDYSLSYKNNTNAGTATVTITGMGNYSGTVEKTFTINKADAVLSFANATVSKTTTDSTFTNTLTKTTDATISFSSSNSSVATVDENGTVTIKGAGTTTITASAAATENYGAESASYVLNVTSSNTWNTSNEFWFSNSKKYFTTGKYTMLDSDFTKLCNYIKKNFSSDSDTYINAITQKREAEWGGSCFGLAMCTLLDYTNQIAFNENFDINKTTMHAVSAPYQNEKVQSAINYYYMSQKIYNILDANEYYWIGSQYWSSGLKKLVDWAKSDKNMLFCFYWNYKNDAGETQVPGHAIVIKGYDGIDENGYHKLITYDNNYPGQDTAILVSSDYTSCKVQGYSASYDVKSNLSQYISPIIIEYLSDFSIYDKIDIDGPNNDMVIEDFSDNDSQSIDGTEICVSLNADIDIMNSEGKYITIEDGQVTDSTIPIQDTHMIANSTIDGEIRPAEMVINVANSDYFSFESSDNNIEASVLNSEQYTSVEVNNSKGVVISSNNEISIYGNKVDYKVYQSVDESDMNMFSLAGTSSGTANISYSDQQIKVTGNVAGEVSVTKYNDGETDNQTFNTTGSDITISLSEEEHTHTWDSGVITKQPTSSEEGIKTYTCTVCGTTKTESIAKLTTQQNIQPTQPTIVVPGTTLTSVKNVKTRKLNIKWVKNTSVNGYVIQMATNKAFTKGVIQKMVYNNQTASIKSQKLKKKKTYYVRICSYMVVNGQTYYSNWSSVKKVKIKK